MLSYQTILMALLISSSLALPVPIRREVPQEHSHQQFLTSVQKSLNLNNPNGIVDSVFGLLGNAAAAGGAGKIADATCLQQATADQAFSNAKAAGDVQGQVDALIYRALERNSGTVGGVTAPCTSIKAVNPEIAAIQQHQDPASPNAAAGNKAIVLELAKQIAAVGGDPQDALKSGTFAPGNVGDNTGKGNTCDVADDAVGCIFTQNLLVEDATAAEIDAAVAGGAAAGGAAAGGAAATKAAPPAATVAPPAAGGATSIGNFGSCSVPKIEFGVGFDGRKESSFRPADLVSYNHGSAQAIAIITQFICDTLTNKCGADATAKKTCATAQAAANAAPPKTGIDADIFNAGFGLATNFRDIEAIDDQGRPIAGSTGGSVDVVAVGGAAAPPATTKAAAATATAVAPPPAAAPATGAASSIGNFGSCSIPKIEFGVGFDGRKESSFRPTDLVSYNHGSAQAISIITQFICDTLTNKCGADATAKKTCADAQAAANAATPKIGIDADIFNAGFGIATDFRDVVAIDNQGKEVAGSTGGSVTVVATKAAAPPAAATTKAAGATAPANTGVASNAGSASTAGNLQTFTGKLGGVAAPTVVASGTQFQVDGNAAFNSKTSALIRSCDVQNNKCADAANASGNKAPLTVSACNAQQATCITNAQSA
jgi:hypothetical protein